MLGVMMGVAALGTMGTIGYMMMDKSKKKKIDKMLSDAADQASKMVKKMDK